MSVSDVSSWPRGHDLVAESRVVLDDAVVDQRQAAGAVDVRVGVALGRAAVRGPAGVADPGGRAAGRVVDRTPSARPACPSRGWRQTPSRRLQRDAGGVVAAVLEAGQTLEEQRQGRVGRRCTPMMPHIGKERLRRAQRVGHNTAQALAHRVGDLLGEGFDHHPHQRFGAA